MGNRKIFLVLWCLIISSVSFISIGYSAFNTSLFISGDAFVRVDADVRINNLELTSKDNGGAETYNSAFSKDLTSMSVSLPNTNSSVKYRVTVTNKNNKYFYLDSVSSTGTYNGNVKYNISGINEHYIYHDNILTFDITFTTTSVNQNANITLKFDFQIIEQTEWVFDHTGSEQTFNVPYNGTYKLEVWGAQGGSYNDTYHGGYGAYVVGDMDLVSGTNLFVNVGQGGTSKNVSPGNTTPLDASYNGGASTRGLWTSNVSAIQTHSTGGGATHIAKVSGELYNLSAYMGAYSSTRLTYDSSEILIVAAGGGGSMMFDAGTSANVKSIGGNGGGIVGLEPNKLSSTQDSHINYYNVPTQNTNSSFSYSNNDSDYDGSFGKSSSAMATGGGGWYGGTSSYFGGSGGSSFIGNPNLRNKVMYCYECSQNLNSEVRTESISSVSTSAVSRSAKKGNGYAKISLILN